MAGLLIEEILNHKLNTNIFRVNMAAFPCQLVHLCGPTSCFGQKSGVPEKGCGLLENSYIELVCRPYLGRLRSFSRPGIGGKESDLPVQRPHKNNSLWFLAVLCKVTC